MDCKGCWGVTSGSSICLRGCGCCLGRALDEGCRQFQVPAGHLAKQNGCSAWSSLAQLSAPHVGGNRKVHLAGIFEGSSILVLISEEGEVKGTLKRPRGGTIVRNLSPEEGPAGSASIGRHRKAVSRSQHCGCSGSDGFILGGLSSALWVFGSVPGL